jgi:phosphoribosyl 1,2-cyclic phosphodiesterase
MASMKFSVLASGSTGNCTYIGADGVNLLIDAGVSGKQIQAALEEIAVSGESIDAILVTHEHSDHIKGVGVMARRFQIPVYATEGTWRELDKVVEGIPESDRHVIKAGDKLEFGELTIEPFTISHDCNEPVGFNIYEGETKLTHVTDLGYVSERVKETIAGADAYIFESNHDVEMLRVGPHPWNVKRRILSDKGHLSNEAAGEALSEVISGDTQDVYLAHLSPDNNVPELAELTVQTILQGAGIQVGEDVQLHQTYRKKPTPIRSLTRR